jgi:hypothetical protein
VLTKDEVKEAKTFAKRRRIKKEIKILRKYQQFLASQGQILPLLKQPTPEEKVVLTKEEIDDALYSRKQSKFKMLKKKARKELKAANHPLNTGFNVTGNNAEIDKVVLTEGEVKEAIANAKKRRIRVEIKILRKHQNLLALQGLMPTPIKQPRPEEVVLTKEEIDDALYRRKRSKFKKLKNKAQKELKAANHPLNTGFNVLNWQ